MDKLLGIDVGSTTVKVCVIDGDEVLYSRSEERRVGKECRL